MAETKRKPGRPAGSNTKKNGSKNKTSAKAKEARLKKEKADRIKDEIWSIVMLAVGVFLFIALQIDEAGQLGHGIKNVLMGTFGIMAYILPYYLIIYALLLFFKRTAHIGSRSLLLLLLIFCMMTLLNSARYLGEGTDYTISISFLTQMFQDGMVAKSGGALGMFVGLILVEIIGMKGLYLLSMVVILISILLVINTPFSQFLDHAKAKKELRNQGIDMEEEDDEEEILAPTSFETGIKSDKKIKAPKRVPAVPESKGMTHGQMNIIDYMNDDALFENSSKLDAAEGLGIDVITPVTPGMGLDNELHNSIADKPPIMIGFDEVPPIEKEDFTNELEKLEQEFEKELDGVAHEEEPKKISKAEAASATLKPEELNLKGPLPKPYQFPSIDLLNSGPKENKDGENELLKAKAAKLEKTLNDFNVKAKVIQVTKGPAVTRYEIQPNTGVKVSSIVRLADDIALNLEAKSIRLEAPIPGKAAVGIEVENERVNMITLREIVESKEFKNAKSKISFAVGKDIAGNAIVADLKGMPHLLIAGSTGSGKSVCINSIIISLLYKSTPEEVRFVLIDPKVVELGNYNGIPHLLIPVVTEPSKAAAALNWAVAEMTDRYKKFAEEGVRDLESYNNRVKEKKEDDKFLPQIVIIIDELADLMMAAPSQVEESICRLAQMARAAGMHLIVATQRPSVDVITGVIKANIPSRVAFAVSSQVDSRTILDMGGAEKLVGKGDMLFNPLGMAKPIRVQGTFISDTEVHKVIEFVKGQAGEAEYSNDVIHSIEKVQSAPDDNDSDELLPEAIETVVKAKQASVSMLQRRFRIGYNRAARLVDMMESRGIIGPSDGSRPRQVFLTEEELFKMDEELKSEEQ